MSDGQITFNTALDNSQLEKDLKDAERQVESLKQKVENSESRKSALEEEMERGQKAIQATDTKLENLKERLAELESAQALDPASFAKAQQEAESVKKEIEETTKQLERQLDAQVKIEQKWKETDADVQRYSDELTAARARQNQLGTEYAHTYSQGSAVLAGSLASMEKRFTAFTSKITKRLKKLFVFSFIFAALASLKGYLTSTIGENERFAASVENLKAVMRGFAAPAVAVLAEVLTNIVNVIAAMMITLARLVDNIFQTNIVQSIQQAQAAAQASQNAADATDNQAKATKRLAKAQKEAARWLAAFDELNVMQAHDNEDIADDYDDLTGGEGASTPNWNAFDVGKIDEKLSAIMIILGAALLAVGAVLAFSGINIPLGLTLMVIGALMIYTAVSENWDKLPQEVRDAINTALVITGIVLIVIGAVLAFSGVSLPVGIGMMLAGFVMLITAAAINWDELPDELRTAISTALVIVGITAIVIGAVLAFSGANIPLGIGIMIFGLVSLFSAAALNWEWLQGHVEDIVETLKVLLAPMGIVAIVLGIILLVAGASAPIGIALVAAGALMIVGAIALNWDYLTEHVGEFIETMKQWLAPIGIIAIVLGVILCVTGVGIPVGVALIIAGAAAIVGSVALNWDWLNDNVGSVIENLKQYLFPAGIVAVVLGVILCVTGVGIPLGVALIALGAGSIVTAIATNQDGILDSIKDTWSDITSWWDSNVAPIFTPGWWGDKFDSITKGLSQPLRDAGNAIHGFANDMCENIGGALSMMGQSWSYSIPAFRVPALASGAVIPPNSEFLAVLGDQSHGRNIEAPESLIRQIVREESGNAQMLTVVEQILAAVQQGKVIECDGYTLGRVVDARNGVAAKIYGR